MDRNQLIERLGRYEWTDLEFKEARNAVPRTAYETVSAFANTRGGRLVFGVRDHGGDLEVVGVRKVDKVQNDFLSVLRSGQKLNRAVEVEAEVAETDGGILLVFTVPESPWNEKPVYLDGDIRRSFVRRGGCNERCTWREIERFMRDASTDRYDAGRCAPVRPAAIRSSDAASAGHRLPVLSPFVRRLDCGSPMARPRRRGGKPRWGVAVGVGALLEALGTPISPGYADDAEERPPARLHRVPRSDHQPAGPPGLRGPRTEGVHTLLPRPYHVLEPRRSLLADRRASGPHGEGREEPGHRSRVSPNRTERASGDRGAGDLPKLAKPWVLSPGDRQRQEPQELRTPSFARCPARRRRAAATERSRPAAGRPTGFGSGLRATQGSSVAHRRQGGHGGTDTQGARSGGFAGGTSPACDRGRRWWALVAHRVGGGPRR